MDESPSEQPEDSPPTPLVSGAVTSGLMSLAIGVEPPRKVRLSCFHDAGVDGEMSIRAELEEGMEMDIMAFYAEAARRLPIADMPELVGCVLRGGHCVGLLDPVSNIIFNALNLLCRRMCTGGGSARPRSSRKEKGAKSTSWVPIAFRSYTGLIAFMRTYFRYLSKGQAMRYLRLAGADLAVAVQLGEHQQFGPEDRHTAAGTPDLCFGRTQFALKVAAAEAGHPVPDDLSRLAKSLPPFKDIKPLATVLQKGRVLGVDVVSGILGSLRWQHYAASPAVQVSFQRRPHPDLDQDSRLAVRPSANFSCVVGEDHECEDQEAY